MKISLLRTNDDAEQDERLNDSIIELYNRHVDTVYRVCFSLMGNRQDAEDAAQTVFIKLMESGKTFQDSEHEKAWLIVTARNHCRDLQRRWWNRKVVHLDNGFVESRMVNGPEMSEIEESLLRIPSSYRLVLYLYYYEGYKIAEIASLLRRNVNTIKTQLRKARKRLKLEMGDRDDG